MGYNMAFSEKVKHTTTIWSSSSTYVYTYANEIKAGPGTDIFIPHSSNNHDSQKVKQLKCSVTDEWTKYGVYIHSIIQLKKEIQFDTHNDMNLEDTMLSEISQSQKDKYYIIPLTRGSQRQKVK